jgi:hypothetical protein
MSYELSVDCFGTLWIIDNFYQNVEIEWLHLHKHEVGKMVNYKSSDYFMDVRSFKRLKSGNYKITSVFTCFTPGMPYVYCAEYIMLLNPQGEILKKQLQVQG